MLDEANFYKNPITNYQLECATTFLDAIFSEDVQEFWSVLAKSEQAYIIGMYETNKHFGVDPRFKEFLKEIQEECQKGFEKVQDDWGISQTARYTKNGDVYVYFFENIQTQVVAIKPLQATVYPLVLSPENEFSDGEYRLVYRLKLSSDFSKKIQFN
ncbi:hypothetical protein KFF76_06170 [Bacillus subtilis]|uniref:hypothetical protein n=1 Tax=Bacillus subtilis TaxID=1423 RepID=UPI001BA60C50|nr:hypothetical protein [Bacillus subtilis]QWF75717.1 hypothetical protein KFF76_06170 [Bacillus subtilis]